MLIARRYSTSGMPKPISSDGSPAAGPALALVEAARACLSGRGEQPDGAVAVGRRRLHRPPVQVRASPEPHQPGRTKSCQRCASPVSGEGREPCAAADMIDMRPAARRRLCEHGPDIGAAELASRSSAPRRGRGRAPSPAGRTRGSLEGLGHDLRQNGGVRRGPCCAPPTPSGEDMTHVQPLRRRAVGARARRPGAAAHAAGPVRPLARAGRFGARPGLRRRAPEPPCCALAS